MLPKKRRRKEVYDIFFGKGQKNESEIDAVIDAYKFNKIGGGELPKHFVKITFVAGFKKQRASISYIYDIEDLSEISDAVKDVNKLIFRKVPERQQTKSLKRINKLKNYLNRIIIDFDTST